MPTKYLAAGVAAGVALFGVVVAVVTFLAPVGPTTVPVESVVFSVPLPLDPAGAPTADQLAGVLNSLQDPGVSFSSKGNLVEGGIGPLEAQVADTQLQKAASNGQLPLTISVANVQSAGNGSATADVTASGPKLAPQTRSVTFINQGGWKVSRGSVMALLREVNSNGT